MENLTRENKHRSSIGLVYEEACRLLCRDAMSQQAGNLHQLQQFKGKFKY